MLFDDPESILANRLLGCHEVRPDLFQDAAEMVLAFAATLAPEVVVPVVPFHDLSGGRGDEQCGQLRVPVELLPDQVCHDWYLDVLPVRAQDSLASHGLGRGRCWAGQNSFPVRHSHFAYHDSGSIVRADAFGRLECMFHSRVCVVIQLHFRWPEVGQEPVFTSEFEYVHGTSSFDV